MVNSITYIKISHCLSALTFDNEQFLQLPGRCGCVRLLILRLPYRRGMQNTPGFISKSSLSEVLLSLGPISCDVQYFHPHDLPCLWLCPGLPSQAPGVCHRWGLGWGLSCGEHLSVAWDVLASSLPLFSLWIRFLLHLPVYFIRKQRLRKTKGTSQGQPG